MKNMQSLKQEQQEAAVVRKDSTDSNNNNKENVHESDQVKSSSNQMEHEKEKKWNVRFQDADIVEFEPTVWTATICSGGVPLGMSVDVRKRTRRRLDSFEGERRTQRIDRQEYMEHGYLEPDERLDILENAGHSVSAMNLVEKEVTRINRERWESNEYDLHYQYGLGEVAMLEDDEEEDIIGNPLSYFDDLEQSDIMMADYDDDDYYQNNSRSMLVDAEVRYAMEEMDCYDDNQKFDPYRVDYADDDCILGATQNVGNPEDNDRLPYEPLDESALSSSPSDVSVAGASECMIVSCSAPLSTSVSEKKAALLPTSPTSPSRMGEACCA